MPPEVSILDRHIFDIILTPRTWEEGGMVRFLIRILGLGLAANMCLRMKNANFQISDKKEHPVL